MNEGAKKHLNNHIGLSMIASVLTNVYFVIWPLIDRTAVNTPLANSLTFWQFFIITNVGLFITSSVAITYNKLLEFLIKIKLLNYLRLIINVFTSVFIFCLSVFGLLIIHFIVSQYYNFDDALNSSISVMSSTYFGSLTTFFAFTSALMFFISNLERRSGNVSKFIAQSFGDSLKPTLVKRGFMLIDLNDATGLAEHLGSIQYAFLLRSCFRILNELVSFTNFEIYQYVGDEAVITWNANHPKADLLAIELFVRYKAGLHENIAAFKKTYGIIPQFKCSVHTGEVVQSEIGTNVKHLIYHGDVLNTASRLLGLCHTLKTDFIITKNSISNKELIQEKYELEAVVADKLKGKTERIPFFIVRSKMNALYKTVFL